MHRRLAADSLALCAIGGFLWLWLPASALAKSLVRFVHAVPGVGRATVSVRQGGGVQQLGTVGFGQVTPWHALHAGRFRWSLSQGAKTLATGTSTVGNGAYDIVVLEHGAGVRLGIFRARGGQKGDALVRVIHAAPELGSPQLSVDGKVAVGRLAFTHATPYLPLAAGHHTLTAQRPGSAPFLSVPATVKAGSAYSEVVMGTRGQRVRVVTLVDRGAPLVRSAPAVAHASGSGGPGDSMFVVRPGDSLWSIARSLVGAQASDAVVQRKLVALWDANARRIGTGDPNLIFPGTRLHL